MTAALALCVVRYSTLPPPELSTMADTRQQQPPVSQSIKQCCGGSGSVFLFGPGPDDFLEKTEMNMFLTENSLILTVPELKSFFFPTEVLGYLLKNCFR